MHVTSLTAKGAVALTVASMAIVCAVCGWLAGSARAEFGITGFTGLVANADGTSATQASAHPHSATATIEFPSAGFLDPDGQPKNTIVDLPPGFIGNPAAVPTKCTFEQLDDPAGAPVCPVSSQVGTVSLRSSGTPFVGGANVYSMVPPPGFPALFGFRLFDAKVLLFPSVRTGGDYGVTVTGRNIQQTLAIGTVSVTFWGVPADPSHDQDRGIGAVGGPASGQQCGEFVDPACSNAAEYPPTAFLTTPANCSAGPLTTILKADEWARPGVFHTASFAVDTNGNPTAVTGCEKVPFNPAIDVRLDSTRADSPTGISVDLTMPQDGLANPKGLAPAPLKEARVTLPEGMTISPSAADGLQACSDAQLDVNGAGPHGCPDASKLGTVTVETPLLDEVLHGGIFVLNQRSNDPESGEMFRLAIVIENEARGIRVKLEGKVRANPQTGRLETTFDNNPQLPFSKLTVRINGGPRAPLATPATCGTHTALSQMTSWSGASVSRSAVFNIDCPGVQGFAPAFKAGTSNPIAGSFTDFGLRIDRPDGQQYLDGVSLRMPTGIVAKLKGVVQCGDADANAGTCPAESRIGTATVGAGPGSHPFFLSSPVSLTGPYKGAPFGLSVAVRVLAGPFDLGTVVVRQALFVDPIDAHVTVVSDPLPTIVQGVPVRLRSVQVDANRPEFVKNPTSCAPKQISGTMHSSENALAGGESPFQARSCAGLAFKPKLSLRLIGKRQRAEGKHPGLRARVTQGLDQANFKQVTTILPLSLALDPNNAQKLCEFEEGQRVQCPKESIVGRATAVTPVLNQPLSGPVYFVKNVRIDPRTGNKIRTLPTLLIPLRGEVAIDLRANSSVKGGRLVTTFAAVPDAPVSSFELNLNGGKHGILVATRNICGRQKPVAEIDADGQNGKRHDFNVRMRSPCPKASKASRTARR